MFNRKEYNKRYRNQRQPKVSIPSDTKGIDTSDTMKALMKSMQKLFFRIKVLEKALNVEVPIDYQLKSEKE